MRKLTIFTAVFIALFVALPGAFVWHGFKWLGRIAEGNKLAYAIRLERMADELDHFEQCGLGSGYRFYLTRLRSASKLFDGTVEELARVNGTTEKAIRCASWLDDDDKVLSNQWLIVPVPVEQSGVLVSNYGRKFHGKKLGCGRGKFNMNSATTVAHRFMPCGTMLEINGNVAVVRDRGPYPKIFGSAQNRQFDLSRALAKRAGVYKAGVAPVLIRVVKMPKSFATLAKARKAIIKKLLKRASWPRNSKSPV